MNESQNGKQVVVSNAGQYSFTYVEYEGGPEIHIRHDQIDFPIYNGYIVTRVYQDEVIILMPGSASGDPRLKFTLEIHVLHAYSE